MSERETRPETPVWAAWFPLVTLGAWFVLQLRTWFSRDFTHDDIYFAYLSWLRAVHARPGADFDVLLYTPLVELFSPFFRLRPESFLGLNAGRAFILAVALALLGMVYTLSRRLGAPVAWALSAVSFTAWQGDFLMRVSDIRTDPVATLFLLAAFLLLLGKDTSRPLLAGTCFGMAVFFNIKLAVAVPAAGLAVVLTSQRTPLRALLRFAAGAILGTLVWDEVRALSDGWGPIADGLRALLSAPPTGGVALVDQFLRRAVLNAPVTVLLLVLGALGTLSAPLLKSLRLGLQDAATDARLVYGAGALIFVAVFLRANPFLFPYNFVVLMPVLGPLLPGLSTLLPRRAPPLARAGLVALATLVPVSEGLAAFSATSGRSNLAQRRVLDWIWQATDRSERVFDWQGLHWGRFGTHHWWMFSGWLPAYKAGTMYSVADELEASRVTLIVDNYRLTWLRGPDRAFVATHYARLDYCLLAPGREFSQAALSAGGSLEVFVPGVYRLDPPDAVPRVLVDGRPSARLMNLGAGRHEVALAPGASPTAASLLFTTERRERFPLPCPAPTTLYYGF